MSSQIFIKKYKPKEFGNKNYKFYKSGTSALKITLNAYFIKLKIIKQ